MNLYVRSMTSGVGGAKEVVTPFDDARIERENDKFVHMIASSTDVNPLGGSVYVAGYYTTKVQLCIEIDGDLYEWRAWSV